ncbi:MAG: hypothetical protein JWP82_1939 [Humibacillus sp.]|nr:hypothetical protein [Humibacillus sp.]
MASRWTTAAAVALVGAALAGCGSTDTPTPSSAVKSAIQLVPTDLAQATSGDTNLDGTADAGAALTPEEFCGFLAKETPKVINLQPAEYAYATFGGAVVTFYTSKGLLTDIDGAGMDALAAKGCPDKAATLLPALGAKTFQELFSR